MQDDRQQNIFLKNSFRMNDEENYAINWVHVQLQCRASRTMEKVGKSILFFGIFLSMKDALEFRALFFKH